MRQPSIELNFDDQFAFRLNNCRSHHSATRCPFDVDVRRLRARLLVRFLKGVRHGQTRDTDEEDGNI